MPSGSPEWQPHHICTCRVPLHNCCAELPVQLLKRALDLASDFTEKGPLVDSRVEEVRYSDRLFVRLLGVAM